MKVFLNIRIPEVGMQLLKQSDIELIFPKEETLTHEKWLSYCQQCDIILNVGHNAFDKTFFEACPNVKAISLFSVGFDHVDVISANQHGVKVGNTPDVLSRATSDTAFLLMQSVARRAMFNFETVKNGSWGSFNPINNLGQELYGKTLGIFGLGRIGYEMAKKCRYAFDMNIIYHNRKGNPIAEKELGAQYVSFEELIEMSDVLSVHANYTSDQQNMFNKEVFERMKPNAIFINTARGGFQDETDLYEAITKGKIWGAGLDVTNPEPMKKSSPLLNLPTVCVLPHIGSATIDARNGMAKRAVENVLAFVKGLEMPYPIN